MRTSVVVMGIAVLLIALPAVAHHSFATEYDLAKPVILKGVVTKFDLRNPHSWLFLNVTDSNGKIVSWGVEMPPRHDLADMAIEKDSIPAGVQVHVEGFLAKNGSNTISGRTIRFPDGRTFVIEDPSSDPITTLDKLKILRPSN